MDNKKYFYLSAFAAIFVYIISLFILLYYLKASNIKKIDAYSKPTVLQLDIVLDIPKDDEKIEYIGSKKTGGYYVK